MMKTNFVILQQFLLGKILRTKLTFKSLLFVKHSGVQVKYSFIEQNKVAMWTRNIHFHIVTEPDVSVQLVLSGKSVTTIMTHDGPFFMRYGSVCIKFSLVSENSCAFCARNS